MEHEDCDGVEGVAAYGCGRIHAKQAGASHNHTFKPADFPARDRAELVMQSLSIGLEMVRAG